jgi:transposase-like protein
MRQASKRIPDSAEKTVRDIRRATRRHHSAEEKIRIVLEGLRGENSIAELCRKEGIKRSDACLRFLKNRNLAAVR